jgi:hypothetical protein
MLALFARGQTTDVSNALTVANALDYALHHDNHGDPIPILNGSTGLHSSYDQATLPASASLHPNSPYSIPRIRCRCSVAFEPVLKLVFQ